MVTRDLAVLLIDGGKPSITSRRGIRSCSARPRRGRPPGARSRRTPPTSWPSPWTPRWSRRMWTSTARPAPTRVASGSRSTWRLRPRRRHRRGAGRHPAPGQRGRGQRRGYHRPARSGAAGPCPPFPEHSTLVVRGDRALATKAFLGHARQAGCRLSVSFELSGIRGNLVRPFDRDIGRRDPRDDVVEHRHNLGLRVGRGQLGLASLDGERRKRKWYKLCAWRSGEPSAGWRRHARVAG
jgi:hypothetical protein